MCVRSVSAERKSVKQFTCTARRWVRSEGDSQRRSTAALSASTCAAFPVSGLNVPAPASCRRNNTKSATNTLVEAGLFQCVHRSGLARTRQHSALETVNCRYSKAHMSTA